MTEAKPEPKPAPQPTPTPAPAKPTPAPTAVAKPTPIKPLAVVKFESIEAFFGAHRPEILKAMAGYLTPDRMLALALDEVRRVPELLMCKPESIFAAVKRGAALGLEFGSSLGHAYLIPFGTEATFVAGYRGLADVAVRCGAALNIDADVVHEKDTFEFWKGTQGDHLKHERARGERGEMVGAYMLAELPSGRIKAYFMDKGEIERRRAVSKMKDGDLWVKWPEEAWKKTVIRNKLKMLPLSHLSEKQRDMMAALLTPDGDEPGGEVIDVRGTVSETSEDAPKSATDAALALAQSTVAQQGGA